MLPVGWEAAQVWVWVVVVWGGGWGGGWEEGWVQVLLWLCW
jgi:hypothetical protein